MPVKKLCEVKVAVYSTFSVCTVRTTEMSQLSFTYV